MEFSARCNLTEKATRKDILSLIFFFIAVAVFKIIIAHIFPHGQNNLNERRPFVGIRTETSEGSNFFGEFFSFIAC